MDTAKNQQSQIAARPKKLGRQDRQTFAILAQMVELLLVQHDNIIRSSEDSSSGVQFKNLAMNHRWIGMNFERLPDPADNLDPTRAAIRAGLIEHLIEVQIWVRH